jgi:hypothetical protein
MQRIHLRTVLAEIDQHEENGQGRAFSLEYYKTDGSKGSKPAVRKGGLSGVGPAAASATKSKRRARCNWWTAKPANPSPSKSACSPTSTGSAFSTAKP